MVGDKLVLWLNDINPDDQPIIGEKAAHLGIFAQNNIPIAPGFVITSDAYTAFIRENNLVKKINKLLETLNRESPESLMQVSAHIKKMMQELPFPTRVNEQITKAYKYLQDHNTIAPLLLSPSLTASDMLPIVYEHQPHASNLIFTEADFHHAIKYAWSYFFEPKVLAWEERFRLDHFRFGIAIVAQTCINAEKSGILYTVDPISFDKNKIVIQTIYGISDLLREGKITPDQYTLNKKDLTVEEKTVLEQEKAMYYKDQGKQISTLSKDAEKEKLTEHQLKTLGELGKQIEQITYFPQEVDWCIVNNTVYILKHQPMTNQPVKDKQAAATHNNLPPLVQGISASKLIAKGTAKVIKSSFDKSHFYPGDILVASEFSRDLLPLLKQARAIISERDSKTSPAAIAAREKGIPAIVGARLATSIIKSGELITVDGAAGMAYKGALSNNDAHPTRTHTTKFYHLITDANRMEANTVTTDGIIFNRKKETDQAIHQLFLQGEKEAAVKELMKHFVVACSLYPKIPVFAKISDISVKAPSFMSCEFEAIRRVRKDEGIMTLSVLLPVIRTPQEFVEIKHLLTDSGLTRSTNFHVWGTIGIPSQVIHFDKLVEHGIDGVSIDLEQLAATILAVDRDMESSFDEQDPSVLWAVNHILKTANVHHLTACMTLTTPFIRSSLLEKLLLLHANTFGLLPEGVEEVEHTITEIQRRHSKYRV